MSAPTEMIRALIVDDSAVMRTLLRSVLGGCPRIELVGTAHDGPEGLAAIETLRPDVVLLDIEMPRMTGLEVLAELRARHLSVRVIMCSTLTRRGAAITLEALARGATDYVAKPSAQNGVREGVETLSRELIPKILALFPVAGTHSPTDAPHLRSGASENTFGPGVVVVGVSTGGPAALETFLPALPADFPLPILVVQHMPRLFTALLAERLDGICPLTVREAGYGDHPKPGTVTLARGDWHMELAGSIAPYHLRLSQGLPEHFCRPSVDILFRSAAARYGAETLAVILTGMGSDGLDGCRAIRAVQGKVLVQDKATSAVWGMPGAVAEAGLADRILPLDAMASAVIRHVSHHRP
ncbi:chemotaxis-specific protein-glutamate methyltransferase CheB [Silvibacterium acidisoli]|uniref:chemotaxis-specific protein-glutamate methyltransferase CheB n=1 Tax=Acidobacteriaceae bacterium ZG23-2 TaxID=2883246 RepID=UPI00406CF7D8